MREIHWAWRNVRARGWRSVLTIGLLALALAANTIVFSVADSLAFLRVVHPNADRLITFETRDAKTGRPGCGFATAALCSTSGGNRPISFPAFTGNLDKTIFLTGSGEPELVPAADVTAGLIEMLGARPQWGRGLSEDDARQADVHAVVIAETLARERFGDPARAIGQKVETTAEPLLVVGVMPVSFRFPDGSQRIWRVFDPRGPLAQNIGILLLARTTPDASAAQLSQAMQARSEVTRRGSWGTRHHGRVASPTENRSSGRGTASHALVAALGAAVSLLLTATANTAGLELAGALGRAKTYAIQLAVGASRGELVLLLLLSSKRCVWWVPPRRRLRCSRISARACWCVICRRRWLAVSTR